MKIEEGKFYRTRDGRKYGPMLWDNALPGWRHKPQNEVKQGDYWHVNGSRFGHSEDRSDLVAEWVDEQNVPSTGPVRTVTRKEIVPGSYGSVYVYERTNDKVEVSVAGSLTAPFLRAAAAVFNELADALEGGA